MGAFQEGRPTSLTIRNLAQIDEVSLRFGDVTVLVGAQATGKSLALQWLKFALDGKEVMRALREAGYSLRTDEAIVELLFGAGMGAAWNEKSEVRLGNSRVTPSRLVYRGRTDGKAQVLFIPAHRAMLMSDGWAAPFQRLTHDTPVVARLFSQHLFEWFSDHRVSKLFPIAGKPKAPYRDAIQRAIFRGGNAVVQEDERHRRRVVLKLDAGRGGDSGISFMAWTAGEREFTPLLLGLYALMPASKVRRLERFDWVVIEEPEMGLHPSVLNVVLILGLELLWRGYRVVISSHSPDMLTAVWMLQHLKKHNARWQLLLEGVGFPASRTLQELAETALRATYRVHYLFYGDGGGVRSQDISERDVASEDLSVAEWGDITAFTSNYGRVVAEAVNENAGGSWE